MTLRLITGIASIMLVSVPSLAQHHDPARPGGAPTEKALERLGDPYPFDVCPVTGKKLGSMRDPHVGLYDGREIRFCCPGCTEEFEADQAANLAAIDEKIIKDQRALYPLKTSIISGKDLPEAPIDFVYGNRLIRLASEDEKAAFLKAPAKNLASLDKAVIAKQGKDYVLKTCPVSKEDFGGDMGPPVDRVIAGRLIRLCCKGCVKEVEKDAKFIALVDAALKGGKPEPADKGKTHDHGK